MSSKGISIIGSPTMKGVCRILKGSKVHDWAALAAAAEDNTTVTVAGAVVGDTVIGVSMSGGTFGTNVFAKGEVTSANTVTVTRTNTDAGSQGNIAATETLTVYVLAERDI